MTSNIGEYIIYDDSDLSNYLAINSTNGYAVQSTTFNQLPDRLITTQKCPGNSDSSIFDSGFDARTVNLTVIVMAVSRTDMINKLNTLKRMLIKPWLRIQNTLTGKYVRVKPTKPNMPETKDNMALVVNLAIDFIAPVPWQLDMNVTTISYPNTSVSPLLFVHDNIGDVLVYPVITISNSSCADITSLDIVNIGDSVTFSFSGILPASSTLVIDNMNKTAEIDGVSVIRYVDGNNWTMLDEGSNSISVQASASSGFLYDFEMSYTPRYV